MLATQDRRYRVVVTVDGHDRVFEDGEYTDLRQAQARVATAVCRFGERGVVHGVRMEVRRTSRATRSAGPWETSAARIGAAAVPDEWTLDRRWDRDVVRRILAQNGLATGSESGPASRGPAPSQPTARPLHPSRAAPEPPATPGPVSDASARREARADAHTRHRATRWSMLTAGALVVVAVVLLFVLQAGGVMLGWPHESSASGSVLRELPFDAQSVPPAPDEFGLSFAPRSVDLPDVDP